MSAEEMLLDPLHLAMDDRADPRRERIASQTVPPVRTIVVDRAPVPVAPPQEREAVRPAYAGGRPERLRLEDVSINYGPKEAVKSVSLSIHQGEVLALIGPSGCGKTTLLRTLNRLTELT
ncbi:MAG TPA: ATP-binding cassette domain-containing protein, partial [Solirubrobacteraceae bacterium]|nr:ATP-binding cassette domain-containing protein [Solirubrobacteraceae bacterium]